MLRLRSTESYGIGKVVYVFLLFFFFSWRSPLSPLPLSLSRMLLIAALAAAAAAVAWWGHGAEVVATCPAADASLHPGIPSVQAQLDELRAELARLATAHEALRAQLSSENAAAT